MSKPSIWAHMSPLVGLLRLPQFTRLQKVALALMVAGAGVAVMLPLLLVLRHWQLNTYMEVEATIRAVEMLAVPLEGNLKTVPEGQVTLDYVASGLAQSVTLGASRFDSNQLTVGNKVHLHVNPNRLNEVETDITWHMILRTLLFTGVAAAIAGCGWSLFRWLRLSSAEPPEQEGDSLDDDDIFEPMPDRHRFRK